jgi:hypothetical protein
MLLPPSMPLPARYRLHRAHRQQLRPAQEAGYILSQRLLLLNLMQQLLLAVQKQ